MSDEVWMVKDESGVAFAVGAFTAEQKPPGLPGSPPYITLIGSFVRLTGTEDYQVIQDITVDSYSVSIASGDVTKIYKRLMMKRQLHKLLDGVDKLSSELLNQSIPQEAKDIILQSPELLEEAKKRLNSTLSSLSKSWIRNK